MSGSLKKASWKEKEIKKEEDEEEPMSEQVQYWALF